MTKTELKVAIEFAQRKVIDCERWLKKNNNNPYRSSVLKDKRDYESEVARLTIEEQRTEPTFSEIDKADVDTLRKWYRHISPNCAKGEYIKERIFNINNNKTNG